MKHKEILYIGGALVVLAGIVWLAKRKSKGGWLPPVTGKLTSGFGPRIDPLNKSVKQVHNGQDIAVPTGTKVKSAADGVIISTASSEGGGNQVIIKHDNGWQTGYAHLSKVLVTKGAKVKKGDVIALSGSTGKHTTGPHLHLTMTNPQGQKVDPKKIVYKTA